MSLNIFNLVMDAVIHHWATVVTPTEMGTGILRLRIINLAAYFYADNGLVVLTQPERLQRALGVLIGLFDQVGLRTNTGKTVSIVCHPYHALVEMSEEAYMRWMTGIRPTFWERQQGWVEYIF